MDVLSLFYEMLLPHSDDDISPFVALFDIPVSLGSLRHREAPIDDRFDLPRFNQFFDKI
jgi:hypothetical protein